MQIAKLFVLAAVLLGGAVLQASAQERMGQPVRVQVGMNFLIPGSIDDANEEASRAREQARRMVYEMAAKECAVLQSVLASSCRLEAMNVNVNRQGGQPMGGFSVHGNMTYLITLK